MLWTEDVSLAAEANRWTLVDASWEDAAADTKLLVLRRRDQLAPHFPASTRWKTARMMR